MWTAWEEVSPKFIITRFQGPGQVLWVKGHSWSSHIFEAPNKYFMSRIVNDLYIHTYTIDISSFQNGFYHPCSSTGFYFKSKIVEDSNKM